MGYRLRVGEPSARNAVGANDAFGLLARSPQWSGFIASPGALLKPGWMLASLPIARRYAMRVPALPTMPSPS